MIQTCKTCSCQFNVKPSDIRRGRGIFCSKSCAAIGVNNSAYKHGSATRSGGQTKEYQTWSGIKVRTTSTTKQNSKYYSLRGIKMCDRWYNSFENFLEDMGEAPSPAHSVDRIDNTKGYYPENCRWATHTEQMNNTRWNKVLTYDGKSMTQEEWGRYLGITGSTICKRLKRGWSLDRTLSV